MVNFTVLPLDVCAPGYMVPQWMPARAPMSVQHGMGTHQQPSQPIPGVVVDVYVCVYTYNMPTNFYLLPFLHVITYTQYRF